MFNEPVGQPVVRPTSVEFIAKITSNAINMAARSARERVSNVKGMLVGSK